MNLISRAGRDDTGEQDVRELRHRFAGEPPTPTGLPNEPHLRDKEDVPHEGALADFYGPEDDVDEELSALVDAGELCMGWDSEAQEAIYWLPEQPEQPQSTPKRSRRAPKPRSRSKLYRRTLLTLVASVAPFFVGMTAEAALDMHAERSHPRDRPDLAGNDVPEPPSEHATYTTYRPTGSAYEHAARHAKVTTSPTVEKPQSYVGKHRKALPEKAVDAMKASKKPESTTPKPAVKATAAPAATVRQAAQTPAAVPPAPAEQKPHTPIEAVVTGVLGTVDSLIK
jgi:cytoskeletal protein RodZ